MRARLHVREGRIGFNREGRHERRRAPDAATPDGDVMPSSRSSAELASLSLDGVSEIELSENIDASERVLFADLRGGDAARIRERLSAIHGVTGVGPDASVTDRIAIGGGPPVIFRRNVRSFFQGNRYLLKRPCRSRRGVRAAGTPTCWICTPVPGCSR